MAVDCEGIKTIVDGLQSPNIINHPTTKYYFLLPETSWCEILDKHSIVSQKDKIVNVFGNPYVNWETLENKLFATFDKQIK
jgi:hypothetical protein